MTVNNLQDLTPRAFEELVASIFEVEGYEVNITPPTRDGGVDVFAERSNRLGLPDQWIIECKFYREDRPIGVDLVRQLLGVRQVLNVRNAALVASSRFTKDAQRVAELGGIELVDRDRLLSWLRTHPPKPASPKKPVRRFQTVFISHSHKDHEFVARLNAALRERGIRTWFSHEEILPGSKLSESIFSAIDSFDRLIVVLSKNSMSSQWVNSELHRAYHRQRKEGHNILFPISIVPHEQIMKWSSFDADSGKDLAVELREFLIPCIEDWTNESKFNQFLDSIAKGLTASNA
jgi:hypothetical protein